MILSTWRNCSSHRIIDLMLQEFNAHYIQKFEFSILYTLDYVLNFEEANFRSSVYFINFRELTADQFFYQLQWFRFQVFRIDLHSSSKHKYFYSHRKSDRSESLFWSETQNVEQFSHLDQSVSRFSNFRYFQMIYHITYSQISWFTCFAVKFRTEFRKRFHFFYFVFVLIINEHCMHVLKFTEEKAFLSYKRTRYFCISQLF